MIYTPKILSGDYNTHSWTHSHDKFDAEKYIHGDHDLDADNILPVHENDNIIEFDIVYAIKTREGAAVRFMDKIRGITIWSTEQRDGLHFFGKSGFPSVMFGKYSFDIVCSDPYTVLGVLLDPLQRKTLVDGNADPEKWFAVQHLADGHEHVQHLIDCGFHYISAKEVVDTWNYKHECLNEAALTWLRRHRRKHTDPKYFNLDHIGLMETKENDLDDLVRNTAKRLNRIN